MNNLKLLIKFPTRSRPDKFFKVLDLYYHLLVTDNYEFVVSCDIDDESMNNDDVKQKLSAYSNLSVHFNSNKSKVEAINNDLQGKDFDILLLASDDMVPEVQGYDAIIKALMYQQFKNLDGVLWFNDGFQNTNLNTLVVVGKNYYNRFNYIYNPSYKSLYCDLEFTEVSKILDKFVYVDKCIIRHQQYSIINEKPDELYIKNDSLQHEDYETFCKRAQQKYYL